MLPDASNSRICSSLAMPYTSVFVGSACGFIGVKVVSIGINPVSFCEFLQTFDSGLFSWFII